MHVYPASVLMTAVVYWMIRAALSGAMISGEGSLPQRGIFVLAKLGDGNDKRRALFYIWLYIHQNHFWQATLPSYMLARAIVCWIRISDIAPLLALQANCIGTGFCSGYLHQL